MNKIEQFAIQTPVYRTTPGVVTGMLWLKADGEWTQEPLAALILTDWDTASEIVQGLPNRSARIETRQTYIPPMLTHDEFHMPLTEHQKLVLRSPGYALFDLPRPDPKPSR